MDILKAREIDPILYEEAKILRVSEKEINEAYDYFDRDEMKELISANIKGVKENTNPLSYKFEDMNAAKIMFPRIMRELISNLSVLNILRVVDLAQKNKNPFTEKDIDALDKIKDILQRLSFFGEDKTIQSKKKKPRPTKETLPIKLLEKAFVSIAANGFREDSEDIQNLKDANIKSAISKIQDFFLDGKPFKQLHSVLLENTEAEWDASTENWMYDGKIAYRKYQDKDSKDVFIELQKGLGLDTISRKEVSSSRESLMEHFDLGDYEKLIEEIMTIVPKTSEEYSEQEEKLLFTTKYNKLESALIEIAMETIELQDKLETHRRSPPKRELDSVEKYLDVAEFLIAVLKLRGDYMALPQIEDPLEDIDVPRNVNLDRSFPELESAAYNYMNKTNVRKKLGE